MSATSIAYPLMIAAMLATAATAQSPSPAPSYGGSPSPAPYYDDAPSPALDCFPYLLKLSDCLTFVSEGSNLTKPDPGCCPELSNLVDTQPICLCQLLADPNQAGIAVDLDKAFKLPSLCGVSTPPVSLCATAGIPVSPLTPSEAPSPAGGGGEGAAPPSPGGESGSPSNLVSKHHLLIGFAAAALSFTYLF